MQDKFEDFIDEHRSEMDVHTPPDRLWDAISKQLPVQKKRTFAPVYLAASCLLFIIGGAAVYFMTHTCHEDVVTPTEITVLQPEIKEAEHYYAAVVATSLDQLNEYSSDYPDLCKNFRTEIDTLGKMYEQLKTDYTNSEGNEAVLQAMVDNLQKQASLITMQIDIIRTLKQRKENTHSHKTKFT